MSGERSCTAPEGRPGPGSSPLSHSSGSNIGARTSDERAARRFRAEGPGPPGQGPPDDGLNPFSFREFLRWKALDPDHAPDEEQDPEQAHSKVFDLGGGACANQVDAALGPANLLCGQQAEETGWGRSLQVGPDRTASTCTEEEEEEEEEEPSFSTTAAGDESRSADEAPTSWRRRSSGRSTEVTQLQEENMLLRRTVRELQQRSEVDEQRLKQLSEELLHRRHQEEEEAQHLDSMVASVEQNLCLMTRRAVQAESSVSRLKAELQQLQAELGSLRSENNALKTAESQVVMTMRANAKTASERLKTTADHACGALRQLMGEAETLHLVSQLLQSIDRISQLHPES